MKRQLIFLLLLLCGCISMQAQYTTYNSFIRKALVIYHRNSKGFYERQVDQMVDDVFDVEKNYAYDKKAQNLYMLTKKGNVVVTLNKDYAKFIKKNNMIPQLKGDELQAEIDKHTKLLDEKYAKLNAQWAQHIQDSIDQIKADSIKAVREHEAKVAAANRKKESYRKSHNYRLVPTNNVSLSCSLCDESVSEDSLYTLGIKNDSIYYLTRKEGALDLTYLEPHASKIPSRLANDEEFKYHYEVFRDSLSCDSIDYLDLVQGLGDYSYHLYVTQLKKEAPYGYFEDWGWDDEYSMITFNFRYANTNPKTIRYIAVYFKVTNGVGDVRRTGYFQGTGPLKYGETASWEWDSSSYFVSGDASNMSITKVVITYMNGTKQVVTGKYLRFN